MNVEVKLKVKMKKATIFLGVQKHNCTARMASVVAWVLLSTHFKRLSRLPYMECSLNWPLGWFSLKVATRRYVPIYEPSLSYCGDTSVSSVGG